MYLKTIPLTPDRKAALLNASYRLGQRLNYAMAGTPAWTLCDGHGNVRLNVSVPLVPFAPPWAEDPRVVNTMLDRVEKALRIGTEYGWTGVA